jgi:RND family efflux transporter MFP subunit
VKRKGLLIAAAFVLLFVTGVVAVDRVLSDRGRTYAVAVREDLVIGAEIKGEMIAEESETIGPPQLLNVWRFQISQLATEGKEVRKGEMVIAFDTNDLNRELQEKRAEADSARKQIEKREADLKLEKETEGLRLEQARAGYRKNELKLETPDEVIRVKDLEDARADFALSEQEIEHLEQKLEAISRAAAEELHILQGKLRRAEARSAELQANIDAMTVKATRDGIVVFVQDWNGQKKKVGDNAWRGEPIIEIPDLSRMKAKGKIDESESGKIRLGQSVTFRLDAHPDTEVRGKIDYVGESVRRESPSVPLKVLPVEIALEKTDPEMMKPGMRFRGVVEIERIPDVVTVPLDAVFDSPDGPVVYARGLSGMRKIPIDLGRRGRDRVEIVKGVDPGDRVVVRGDSDEETK